MTCLYERSGKNKKRVDFLLLYLEMKINVHLQNDHNLLSFEIFFHGRMGVSYWYMQCISDGFVSHFLKQKIQV